MKEDFLQFIWKYKLYNNESLIKTDGEPVEVISPGTHNTHAGPDFIDVRARIGIILN